VAAAQPSTVPTRASCTVYPIDIATARKIDFVFFLDQMKDTILLGGLKKSVGNSPHAAAMLGGFMYDAIEVVAIPLCKDALDYCCSTTMVKTLFFVLAQK